MSRAYLIAYPQQNALEDRCSETFKASRGPARQGCQGTEPELWNGYLQQGVSAASHSKGGALNHQELRTAAGTNLGPRFLKAGKHAAFLRFRNLSLPTSSLPLHFCKSLDG